MAASYLSNQFRLSFGRLSVTPAGMGGSSAGIADEIHKVRTAIIVISIDLFIHNLPLSISFSG
jgi:hypothetical protein